MASASLWLGQSIAVRHKRHIDFAIQVHPEQIARGQKKIPVKVSQQLTGRYREDPSFCLPSCRQALWVQPLLPSPLFPLSSLHDVSIYRLRLSLLSIIMQLISNISSGGGQRNSSHQLSRSVPFRDVPPGGIAIQPHLFSTMQVGSSARKSPL